MANRFGLPDLGVGLGLRTVHYARIAETQPEVDWFEVLSENYMQTGGRPLEWLDVIADRYPVAMHGVSLSIGSTDPLDRTYLTELRALRDRCRARWVSDHLCWTGVGGKNTHDLLPMPYTEEALRHVCARVRAVQDFLGAPLALENPSTYVEFTDGEMPEWEFLARLAEEADCALLLDVNNVYVSAYNHGFDPRRYLAAVPFDRVVQLHVAGHTNHGTHIVDSHIGPVIDDVWRLLGEAWKRAGGASVLLEWDAEIPGFEETHAEALRAKEFIGGARVKLAETQRWFAGAVMNDAAIDEADRRLTPGPKLGPRERLDVYRDGYVARLVECLADDYPVLARTLGEEAFEALCRRYIAQHPSEAPNLNAYGRHMAAMCDGFAADLARLEWAVVEVIHEPAAAPLTMEKLATVPMEAWGTARLVASRALRVVTAGHPVNDYFQAVKDGGSPGTPGPGASATLVYRSGKTVWRMGLTPPMLRVLAALLDGRALEPALDLAGDEPAEHVTAWFREWVSSGLFVGIELA